MTIATEKRFDDANDYDREIRLLVPGYDTLHSIASTTLRTTLQNTRARVLVVGCGTGAEVVDLAQREPNWIVDALDPSSEMIAAATRITEERKLSERVQVHCTALQQFEPSEPYDAVMAILVGHFIPDDGRREHFLISIGKALRIGGLAVLADLEDSGPAQGKLIAAHVRWSRDAGLSETRADLLEARLAHGFHPLSANRRSELFNQTGLRERAELFRCFGIVSRLVERVSPA